MAWYYGTYSCGHEGRVDIIGPVKNRQWIADRKFEGLCPECCEKYLEEQKERKNAEAAEKAKEMELPELQGTEKQVAWANTLRQQFIDDFSDADRKDDEIKQLLIVQDYILKNKVNASYWIDNRYTGTFQLLRAESKEALKTDEQEIEEKTELEIKAESIVKPEGSTMEGVVEITVKDDKVTAAYEKNDTFREIVKSLGYKWDGVWIKQIRETTGSAQDRAAELGNKLLNAGFPIMILDPEIRDKAVKGQYEPECDRWIYKRLDTDCFAIKWSGYNDDLYQKAKTLPGAYWDRGNMIIKIAHYKEVQDFANICGFKFTKAAQQAIEEYKEAENKAKTVNPAKVEKAEYKDGLQEILNSGSDILDDLKD